MSECVQTLGARPAITATDFGGEIEAHLAGLHRMAGIEAVAARAAGGNLAARACHLVDDEILAAALASQALDTERVKLHRQVRLVARAQKLPRTKGQLRTHADKLLHLQRHVHQQVAVVAVRDALRSGGGGEGVGSGWGWGCQGVALLGTAWRRQPLRWLREG